MDMLDEVLRVLTLYNDDNFKTNPYVPRDIEQYARAALDIPDDDYVLASLRTSFKKFHRGMIIGREGIYWANGNKIETSCNQLTWRELSERKDQFKTLSKRVCLGDGAVFDTTGSITSNRAVINLLDVLIERYEQQESSESGFIFDENSPHTLAKTIPLNKEELRADNAKSAAEVVSPGQYIVDLLKSLWGKINPPK